MVKKDERLKWFHYYLDYMVDQRFAYPNSKWEAMLRQWRLVINCEQPVRSFDDWLIYQNRRDLI